MTHVREQPLAVKFLIEVWTQEQSEPLYSYEAELSFPRSKVLRESAERMGAPLETAAYIIFQSQVQQELRTHWPGCTIKVRPASPLSFTTG
ncbi:hypothetical protein GCM10023321_26000 [Pseudonocardia eucalypti]|uniref:Uncharacterized protein n=1 Tax=Pseudonocardia eucalypti TaxID=648755 RepID=A0ABP9PYM5_9PSEU|nr:hypothetical protein [Pseudonocardia eucalypti]